MPDTCLMTPTEVGLLGVLFVGVGPCGLGVGLGACPNGAALGGIVPEISLVSCTPSMPATRA